MDKQQINKQERNEALIQYLDANAEKWLSIAKIAEFKLAFSVVYNEIKETHKTQSEAQVSLGGNKASLKKIIAEKADILNDLVEAFASVTGNAALESRMAASATELNRLKNEDFLVRIKEIVTEAENHSNVLQNEYGMTAEQLDDLKNDVDSYLALKNMPRAYKIASVQATGDLESLFKKANDILTTKLNKVMKVFKHRDPNFYRGYLAASTIIDD